jgi:hypothetical protein
MEGERISIMEQLRGVTDPRGRQGRVYPLESLLGMLLLGALHGETSLRGMWQWAIVRWEQVWEPLGFVRAERQPALTTFWNLLRQVDVSALAAVLSAWVRELTGRKVTRLALDGKQLRGSKREGEAALSVMTLAAEQVGAVWAETKVVAGDTVAAALTLLKELPLAGRVVTFDAGLLHREVLETLHAREAFYVAALKANNAPLKALVDEWITVAVGTKDGRSPHHAQTIEKQKGRIEKRSLWVVPAEGLGSYLADEFGWHGITHVGWIHRARRRPTDPMWQDEETTFVASLPPRQAKPNSLLTLLRSHWHIENCVFRVRDVTFHEDQGHARQTALPLAHLRNTAITMIRALGHQYIPDGWRSISANLDAALGLLLKPLKN